MKKLLLIVTACAIFSTLTLSTTLQAAIIGAQAGVSTISPCPSFCSGPGIMSAFDSDGGEGSTSAFATLANSDGSGTAIASLPGSLGLPELRGASFSEQNSRVGTGSTAMQHYSYSGAATTLALNIDLTGTATVFEANDRATIRGNVVIISGNLDDFGFSTDFASLVFGALSPEDILGQSSLSLPDDGNPQSETDLVSFHVNDGDNFFVWANLRTSGTRGGTADALNTLALNFTDPTGLSPSSVVPIPGTGLLFGSALVAAAWTRRKQKIAGQSD